jgi:hypothetical protein
MIWAGGALLSELNGVSIHCPPHCPFIEVWRDVTSRDPSSTVVPCRSPNVELDFCRSQLNAQPWLVSVEPGWAGLFVAHLDTRTQLIVPALLAMPGTVVMVVYSLSCPTTMVMLAPTLSLTSVAHRISTLTSVGWARLGRTFCRPPWHTGRNSSRQPYSQCLVKETTVVMVVYALSFSNHHGHARPNVELDFCRSPLNAQPWLVSVEPGWAGLLVAHLDTPNVLNSSCRPYPTRIPGERNE